MKLTAAELKQIEAVKASCSEGVPLKSALAISQAVIEFIYFQGDQAYRLKKYDEAEKYFNFLFLLDPADPRFTFALGSTYHMKHDFVKANGWYLATACIDEKTPLPYYHMSDCAMQQGYLETAIFWLKKTVERIGTAQEQQMLKSRCLISLEGLEKKRVKEAAI
jgi:tetratricopeptide (TPR) repeat protein